MITLCTFGVHKYSKWESVRDKYGDSNLAKCCLKCGYIKTLTWDMTVVSKNDVDRLHQKYLGKQGILKRIK
jgi:hypothetical protein